MEKERLKYTIDRFDHYYESVNNKSNLVLGLSTFILGGLIALYPALNTIIEFDMWLLLFLFLLIGLGLVAVLILIAASLPHMTPKKESLHYFQSVANMTSSEFSKKSKALNHEDELRDLRDQTVLLAKGLSKKYLKLKQSLIIIRIQFILIVPFVIFILYNSNTN